MRKLNTIIGLTLSIILINASIMKNEAKAIGNPLFLKGNELVDFGSFTAENVKEVTESVINEVNAGLNVIYKIEAGKRTFENSIEGFDRLYDKLNGIHSIIFLMAYVHPDSAIRNDAQAAVARFNKYMNEILLDENLYHVFTEYAATPEAKTINDAGKRLIKEQIAEFNRNGFKLPEDKRKELKEIKDKISDISLQFSTNITEYKDKLIITDNDTAGLPMDYLESRKQEDGTYSIDLSYPSYKPFMKYSKNGGLREELQTKYLNRAADKNIEVLQDLLKERKKMSQLLGYESYAAYTLENKMAKTPKVVWDFENSLIEKVKEKAIADYAEVLEVKNSIVHEKSDKVYSWESSYYDNILLKQQYDLDQELLKEYFEMGNVLDGIFTITQKLFGIKIAQLGNAPVWHEEVKAYKVEEGDKTIGYFYLDLHPRDNKYSHAACFSMVNGVKNDKVNQVPTATLVCNFPRATRDKPSLIPHSDVVTMFHEFGHLIHHLLAVTPVSMMSGISNSRDFVEVPSQFLENWAWSYESLKLFAKHYKTGEVLPGSLHKKMIDSRNVGSGLANVQQVYYGYLDMTLHDKYDPFGDVTTTEIVKNLQNKITLFPYVENTHMQAAFGHLTGYAAGYYGYLWAKVYAEDCFSLFEEGGILNQEIGLRFRKEVLSKGSSKDEMDLIKAFLQREPNDKAFVKSLGL